MTAQITETCLDSTRRADVRRHGKNGIDYVDVSENQPTLTVYFLSRAPQDLEKANLIIDAGSRGRPVRVVDVRLSSVDDPEQDDSMIVLLDRRGDRGSYTLRVVELDAEGSTTDKPLAGFDPRYACLDFRFDTEVISDVDCKQLQTCVPPPLRSPDINYLAKDYGSFLQLIYDRLALIMPAWQEQHEPDELIALVEILAYVGDYLSYYQDAVATEAYLATARQRISVRRHVRLLDYHMHEGCNARAWLTINTSEKVLGLDPGTINFVAAYQSSASPGAMLSPADLMSSGSYLVFEPTATQPFDLYPAHNTIQFYCWGDQQCCLPAGAISATLLDGWEQESTSGPMQAQKAEQSGRRKKTQVSAASLEPMDAAKTAPVRTRSLHLKPGDVLLLKEVIGPGTGSTDDADPTHQQFVLLTKVTPASDSLYDPPVPVVEVEWAAADALTFPLCLSTIGPAAQYCQGLSGVSVACGNVFMADQGSWIRNETVGTAPLATQQQSCTRANQPANMQITAGRFQPTLQNASLTFRQAPGSRESATVALIQDPRLALPQINLRGILPLPDGSGPWFSPAEFLKPQLLASRIANPQDEASRWLAERFSQPTISLLKAFDPQQPMKPALASALAEEMQSLMRSWTPRSDLLASQANDADYVVEMDDSGIAHLRFGDGELGRAVEAGETFIADYRVGIGTAGNIGAGTIQNLVILSDSDKVTGSNLTVTNPLATQGGTAPESVDEVKLFAPGTFLTALERAITADDYATIAERNPKVQRAAATLLWTGTCYEAHVAIDPLGTDVVDPNLILEIKDYLYRFRRIGHDLVVVPAQYVPLDIAMTVNVLSDYIAGHVYTALLDAFSDRVLADGSLGFFHPDNLSFGDNIYLSQLIATAQSVTGVANVAVTRLERLYAGPNNELESGVLAIGPLEVAQLDNDPAAPEHGKLVLTLRGGL